MGSGQGHNPHFGPFRIPPAPRPATRTPCASHLRRGVGGPRPLPPSRSLRTYSRSWPRSCTRFWSRWAQLWGSCCRLKVRAEGRGDRGWCVWGGRGVGMSPLVYFARLQPAGLSPFAALPLDPFPPSAVVPISLSPPRALPPCPILPSPLPFPFPWPFPPSAVVSIGLSPLLRFPFPWSVVPTEPPDLPCFTSLCVESTQRKATAFAVGQVRASDHPKLAVKYLSPTAAGGPWDVYLWARFPDGGTCGVGGGYGGCIGLRRPVLGGCQWKCEPMAGPSSHSPGQFHCTGSHAPPPPK